MRVADYIMDFLSQQGVDDIFMLSGNGAMYLNDAIAESNMNYFCARNEAAAPMMAEAYARVRQSLGAVCVTAGPGAANAVSGLTEAWVDSAPIIVISGQVPTGHTTQTADTPGLRTFGTAEINIVPVVESITKYGAMVTDPQSVRYHLEKAVHLATTGRPGPVWLDVPLDIQYAEVDPEDMEGFQAPEPQFSGEDLDSQVDAVIDLMSRSQRPLLIGGHGIRQGGAIQELKDLLDLAGTPIIFSRLGQDILPHSHPLNFGQAGLKGSKYCASIMESADLVISLGSRLAIQLVGHNFDAFSPDASVVMVDLDEAELKKPGVKIDLPIHRDAKQFLQRLIEKLKEQTLPEWDGWAEYCRDLESQNPMVTPAQKKDPIDLYYFMSRLDALSDTHHVFVTDAGSNYYVGGQVYKFEHGQREITSGAFAAMGLSIPLAIGASVADRKTQVLAVTGDGSLELNLQELKTMSHYDLDIKLFVINNGGYVSMRNWQDGFFDGRRIETAEATGIGTLDMSRIADAFNLRFQRISSHKEIDQKIKQVLSDRSPTFIEVVCDDQQRIIEPIKDLSYDVSQVTPDPGSDTI